LLKLSYQAGDWPLAVQCADQLLAIDPGDSGALAVRGDSRLHLQQVEAAIADIRRAVELNPSALELRRWLAERYVQADRTADLQEQLQIIERLRSAKPPALN
jgi:tetratricopeptide (TPR) repeat protein